MKAPVDVGYNRHLAVMTASAPLTTK